MNPVWVSSHGALPSSPFQSTTGDAPRHVSWNPQSWSLPTSSMLDWDFPWNQPSMWRFPEIGVLPNHPCSWYFPGIFQYKPSILGGTPMTLETPIQPLEYYRSPRNHYKSTHSCATSMTMGPPHVKTCHLRKAGPSTSLTMTGCLTPLWGCKVTKTMKRTWIAKSIYKCFDYAL